MNNQVNASVKILEILRDANNFPVTKQEMSDKLNYSAGYLARPLSQLKKAGYLSESRGYYYITPKGREDFETGQLENIFHTDRDKRIKQTIDTDNLTAIDWQIIHNKSQFDNDPLAARRLKPMAIAYFYAANISFHVPHNIEVPQPTHDDEVILMAIQAFLEVFKSDEQD